jgi:hypothetical protein
MKIILIISFVLLVGCSAKFDGFDPSTSMVKWILTSEKDN